MAVPKHKVSKRRGRSRFANWSIKSASIGECPSCHEMKPTHRICPHCGFYDGVKKIEVKQENE